MTNLGPFADREPLAWGTESGIDWAIVDNAALPGVINGYARIPEDHPWHNLPYNEVNDLDLDVHGGITFSGGDTGHWIGFDTAHAFDTSPLMRQWMPDLPNVGGIPQIHWTAEKVAREAMSLAQQIAAARH